MALRAGVSAPIDDQAVVPVSAVMPGSSAGPGAVVAVTSVGNVPIASILPPSGSYHPVSQHGPHVAGGAPQTAETRAANTRYGVGLGGGGGPISSMGTQFLPVFPTGTAFTGGHHKAKGNGKYPKAHRRYRLRLK